jgi:hypothetical protein
MTRTLFAMLFALSIAFVSGCGGTTETTLIEAEVPQTTEQEEADYEAEMDAVESDGEGDEG